MKLNRPGAWGLLPLGLFFLLFFLSGTGLAVVQSLGIWVPGGENFQGGEAYLSLLSQGWLWQSLGFSLWVAASSSFISLVLGLFLAYGIWTLGAGARKVAGIYKIPVVLPHITVAFLFLLAWGPSGILSSLFYHLGLGENAREVFGFLSYSGFGLGIILSYIFKEAPFVVLMVLAVLDRIPPALMDTGRMLGAGKMESFTRIILPMLVPVLVSTFSIIFLYSLGAFEIPFLVGESHPKILSIEAYQLYFDSDLYQRARAMAFLVMILVFVLLFLWVYFSTISRKDYKGRKL